MIGSERPSWMVWWLGCGSLAFLSAFFLIDKSVVVDDFFYIGVLAPAVLLTRWRDLGSFHSEPMVNAFFLVFAYLALSNFWSPAPDFLRYLKRFLYLYGLGLACYLLVQRHQRQESRVIRWLAVFITLSTVFAACHFYIDHDFPGTRLEGIGRLQSPIYMPAIVLAYTMAALLDWEQLTKAWRATLSIALLFGCALIYLCQSRSALAALVGIAVIFLCFSMRRQAVLLGGALSIVAALALVFSPELLMERGTSFRTIIWSTIFERFVTHCHYLIGCGVGSEGSVTWNGIYFDHPHSVYLSWLLYAGIIGLLAYVAVAAAMLFRLWRLGEYRWMLILSMGLGITFTTTDQLLVTPNHNWLLLHIPFAIGLAKLAWVRELARTRSCRSSVGPVVSE